MSYLNVKYAYIEILKTTFQENESKRYHDLKLQNHLLEAKSRKPMCHLYEGHYIQGGEIMVAFC